MKKCKISDKIDCFLLSILQLIIGMFVLPLIHFYVYWIRES